MLSSGCGAVGERRPAEEYRVRLRTANPRENLPKYLGVAQLVARRAGGAEVASSSLVTQTKIIGGIRETINIV